MTRRIEVPVCIKKPSRSTVYQPERSYTVPSVNRLSAGACIYRAVGQQTPSSVGSLRKVGRLSPGVQRVNIPCRRYTDFWRHREVCAKSAYLLLASKELIYNSCISLKTTSCFITNAFNELVVILLTYPGF